MHIRDIVQDKKKDHGKWPLGGRGQETSLWGHYDIH